MNSPEIRAATEYDLPAINEIYNHYVLNSTCTYQEELEAMSHRRDWFAAHDSAHPITVAMIDDRVVGWGAISPFHRRSAYRHTVEDSIYVAESWQRKGIGSLLLKDLIQRARTIGHRNIIALIDATQSGSIAMHEQQGFEQAGHLREVGFKFDRWLDVIYLQHTLHAEGKVHVLPA